MTDAQIIQLVLTLALALLGLVAIVGLVYAHKTGNSTLETALYGFQNMAELAFAKGDQALEAYGTQLKPANDLLTAGLTLIDEPTDFLSQLLPDATEDTLRELLMRFQQLTDGKPLVINSTAAPAGVKAARNAATLTREVNIGGTTPRA